MAGKYHAGVALCIIVIGVQMAFKSENIMVVIFSLVLGAIVGEALDIDAKLQNSAIGSARKLLADVTLVRLKR